MKRKFPKVTIVTVTYNAQEYLEQTIKSVIEQDYKNIEYIIIDGNSSDGTVDIIKKYESHITYWVSEPDSGIYDAMNKGINAATGEWINFMNAGDSFCEKNTVSKVKKYFKSDSELICGDIYHVDEDDKKYKRSNKTYEAFDGMFCFHQSLFTQINIMKKYKFNTNYKMAGDYDFVLKCYVNNHKFKFLDFAVANFLAGGLSEQNEILSRIEDMFIQSRYLENMSDIYKLNSFASFESYQESNNRLLSKLMNNFYEELDQLKLENKKFVLYGYGNFGQLIYEKFKVNIIKVVDQNYLHLNKKFNMDIKNVNELKTMEFDYILISVLGREVEIEDILIKKHFVDKNKILKLNL